MFDRNYHYLVAGLPDIILDQKKLSLIIDDFREELKYHLHKDDYSLVELFFLPFDNTNILNLLLKNKKPFNPSGNYPQSFLEEEIKEPVSLPSYLRQFIPAFKNDTPVFPGYSWENQLTWLYYDYVLQTNNVFIKTWFEFNLHLNNILTAFNLRKYKLAKEFVFIGDNFITEALKRSTLKDFGLSNDFIFMEKLVSIDENGNSMEKERAVDILRWNYLDELNTFNYFSIEVLLSFLIKLFIVERWIKLDPETGRKMFRQIINDLEKSYEFPKEFKINEVRK